MNKNIIAGVSVLIIGFGLIGFLLLNDGDANNNESNETTTETASQDELPVNSSDSASGTALSGSPEAQQSDTPGDLTGPGETVDVDMSNFEFSTDLITASPGDTVTVNLINSGGTHDFVIDEFGVQSETINTGETTSVTFTVPADAEGEYEYYCSIGNHREQGMVGTLVVQ
ncbi:TPA: hypothetical protein EYO12_03640 [Candidatus Saccharibacteria bacterium]|nr:hypothetical protein [Candidatus Saccharibacteria bacterium]HIO87876.1 hypothetical protein [Candidatus Saccharibacteria bacterium]